MSRTEWTYSLQTELLSFLWRQWTQLGVAGNAGGVDGWLIDPEALLFFTLKMGRYDQRLFDEVIDWVQLNERWISIQRLKNLLRAFDDEALERTLSGIARRMSARETRGRWKTLSQEGNGTSQEEESFFIGHGFEDSLDKEDADLDFRSAGWLRSPVRTRGHSISIPFDRKSNQLLRLRALFGLSPRAETIAYLVSHQGANASTIGRATGYSRPPIQDVLEDLLAGGYVGLRTTGRSKDYTLDSVKFLGLLSFQNNYPAWVEWSRVFKCLVNMMDTLSALDIETNSDYLVRSRLVALSSLMDQGLSGSGFENPFMHPLLLDDALEGFDIRLNRLLRALNP